ncbi:MAG: hypothetical protein ABI868_16215 [Acidobacteriota bacterium]
MFSRSSRYRALPDIVATDAQGRTLVSKTLRPLPPVSGTVGHTVEGVDRLDHLAYKYYQQPYKWWRLADANPEVLSPPALLGKEPIVTDRFRLEFDGAQPPWAALVQNLTAQTGVEEAAVVEDVRLVPARRTVSGQIVTLHIEEFERAVLVTYNRLNASDQVLAAIITASGFTVRPAERLGRVGRQIIIPRDVTA